MPDRPHLTLHRRGLMFVLSSPSGAGKTTMSRRLLVDDPDIVISVSATTRPPRTGEIEGRDYRFVDDAGFDALVANDELLEWAKVFGYRYGTPRGPVEKTLHEGRDSEPVIAQRMRRAATEISHWGEYNYILINDDPDRCLGEIRAILKAERLRRKRQLGLANFVRDMLS